MATSDGPAKQRATKDLRGIRKRGTAYQVRVFGGQDPVTGRPVMLTGTAPDERAAIRMRDKFRVEVNEDRAARTQATFAYLLRTWLDNHKADYNTVQNYRFLAETFVIPKLGSTPLTKLGRLGPHGFDQLYSALRRCRRLCDGSTFVEHHTKCEPDVEGVRRCDKRCKAHVCKPVSESTLRQIHTVCNGAFKAAVRWGWLGVNPLDATLRPRAPQPEPTPPSATDAARIIDSAMSMDEDWGAFVWLTMVTGARRGELVALRWKDIKLQCGACGVGIDWKDDTCAVCGHDLTKEGREATLDVRKGYVRRNGRAQEKDTKTHQMRRISLDATTTDILVTLHSRYVAHIEALDGKPREDAYVFSYSADHLRPCSPDGLTHRYTRMTKELGLETHLHELRHYSATELLSAGVDLRTVAGRLGHAGGGATTLRVYAAWVPSADQRAAALLASRLPRRRSKPE